MKHLYNFMVSEQQDGSMCNHEHLDVDEVLAVFDDVDVGVVNGLLVVLDASGPVRGRAQNLRKRR